MADTPLPDAPAHAAGEGYWQLVWRQFRNRRLASISFAVIVILFLLAAWAPLLANGKPFYWREIPFGASQAVTTYPLLQYLVAPTQEFSVEYLFNYFCILTLTLPLVCLPAYLLSRGRGLAPKAVRKRSTYAVLGAFALAALPFLAPGFVTRAATKVERAADPAMAQRLKEIEAEYAAGKLVGEAYATAKREAAAVTEFRILRSWRLDERPYLSDFADLREGNAEVEAIFPPVSADPVVNTSETLHPPGVYGRLGARRYRKIDVESIDEPLPPGVSRICLVATVNEISGGDVRILERDTRVHIEEDETRAQLKDLRAGDRAWFMGRRVEAEGGGAPRFVAEAVRPESRPPAWTRHLLGTDRDGRDVLARMLLGSRISLSVGIVSVGIYVLLGILIGGLAGYFRGIVDLAISRLIELVICFPSFFLILVILATIEKRSIFLVMLIIGLTSWTGVARLIRGEFLKLADQDFVHSARALGCGSLRIMFRHILPNAMGPVLVAAAFGVASAVLTESSLSYLGFGAPPPTPTWGEMIKQGKDNIEVAWWLLVYPGAMIFLTVTAYNLAGDGLRDAMDPRMKR
ncbi:MAG: ABC transporter permease [Planctomycetes bacterium]|nr:ABC transporter permease [Planctomycetota bacterium]